MSLLARFKIITKILAVIMLLAGVAAGTSWLGIRAMSAMNEDAETIASAAKRALEASRASTSLITLSSAEFQVALDPRPESRALVRKVVDEQTKLLNERVEYFGKTRDEKTQAMMPALKDAISVYKKSLEQTLQLADETKDVQLTEQVERLRASAMKSQAIAVKLRAEMRTDESNPPLTFYPPFFYCWTTAQFANRGLHLFFKERSPGDTIYISGEEVFSAGTRSKERVQLRDVAHDVVWAKDPYGQTLEGAALEARFSNGSQRRLKIRALPARYFLKAGLYGGLEGWSHGDDKGKLYVEHDVWSLADPTIRRLARTLSDHVIEVTDGDEVGYGIIEYGVGKDYARYAEVQNHPPI